jgi:hypothetical protein
MCVIRVYVYRSQASGLFEVCECRHIQIGDCSAPDYCEVEHDELFVKG